MLNIQLIIKDREYDAKLDSKKRITIRGTSTEFYYVTEKKMEPLN